MNLGFYDRAYVFDYLLNPRWFPLFLWLAYFYTLDVQNKRVGTAMLWSFSIESLNFFRRNGRVYEQTHIKSHGNKQKLQVSHEMFHVYSFCPLIF